MGISTEVLRSHVIVQECVKTPPGALEDHKYFLSVLLTIQNGRISLLFEILQKKHMNRFLFLQL